MAERPAPRRRQRRASEGTRVPDRTLGHHGEFEDCHDGVVPADDDCGGITDAELQEAITDRATGKISDRELRAVIAARAAG